MGEGVRPVRWLLLLFVVIWGCACSVTADDSEVQAEGAAGTFFPSEEGSGQELFEEQEIADYIDLDAIEYRVDVFSETEKLSFTQLVTGFLRGEIPFELKKLPSLLVDLLFREIKEQKQMALQIIWIVLASALFSNFVRMFDNSQIADISFYMVYLLISALLVRSFSSLAEIVSGTCSAMNDFMKVLLPSYIGTVVLGAGTVTAVGFYEITVFAINLLQIFIIRLVLPAINFYLILLILNQMAKEDYFSRLAGLVETVVGWMTKTLLGLVIGLQTVQCLMAPAIDSLKNSSVHRLARAIPGVGTVLDTAAETVAGSALVIKNAVGIAGIVVLAAICLTPLLKLAACIFVFHFLCAVIQPVSEKRMVEGIESISRGAVLLLRVLAASVSVFVISLAMITAAG